MSKYSIYTDSSANVHTVKVASVESAPDYDYFHVTQTGDTIQCDCDEPARLSGKPCSHIKAVRRHLAKQAA